MIIPKKERHDKVSSMKNLSRKYLFIAYVSKHVTNTILVSKKANVRPQKLLLKRKSVFFIAFAP